MPKTYSPLRYPGGKAKLYKLILPVISNNLKGSNRTYVEPFAGGAGLALKLLHNGDVDKIVLNDIDYHIYSFWNTCINNSDELCKLISDCKVNMETWETQKEIYNNTSDHSELEVAFSTFFLNRCNISGIICGGPIGGKAQTGNYRMDARFNKDDLIDKIQWIYQHRNNIEFYNMDASDLINEILPKYDIKHTILNIDPPYVKKGPLLYKNSFSKDDHRNLSNVIKLLQYNWIITYDECELIYNLYSQFRKEIITLSYSVGHNKSGRELMIYSDGIDLLF